LPSYPEVALRLQHLLADIDTSTERITRILVGEPTLSARIMAIANSAALNVRGIPVEDLRAAVTRVGFDTLRTSVISFSVSQLRRAQEYKFILEPMAVLWHESVSTAAMSFVLSRRLKRFTPDKAMLAGMVSGVGKLYVLTRASQFPALFADEESYTTIVRQWHCQVARSILENWQLAPEIIESVAGIEEACLDEGSESTLADLLSSSQLLISLMDTPDLLLAALPEHRAAARMGLTPEGCPEMLQAVKDEYSSLRQALGR
jgi:HD-like signal output (HDOD) protein